MPELLLPDLYVIQLVQPTKEKKLEDYQLQFDLNYDGLIDSTEKKFK